jgi:transposase
MKNEHAPDLPMSGKSTEEEVLRLKARVEELESEKKELMLKLTNLLAQVAWFRKQMFGKKSEQLDTNQLLLKLGEVEKLQKQLESVQQQQISYTRTISTEPKPAIPESSYKHLPIGTEVTIEPDEVKANPDAFVQIGCETHTELDVIPPKFVRNLTHRPKFVRKERSREDKSGAPIIAPAPARIFESGHISPGLLSHIAINKYLYHLPLYRQEKMFYQQSAVRIPRQTMCDGIEAISSWLEPIFKAQLRVAKESGYLQVDETPVKFIDGDEKRDATQTGYIWIANNPDGEIVYIWHTQRDVAGIEKILGEDYKGILQTDGYSAYGSYIKKHPGVIWLNCWVHARREFYNALASSPKEASQALDLIGKLYAHERDWNAATLAQRAKRWPPGSSPPDAATQTAFERECHAERERLRKENFPEIFGQLHDLATSWAERALPQSLLGKATQYLLNHWSQLVAVKDHGVARLDNNSVENAVRPCTLGRKNWLFIGHSDAGQRSATLYSIFASCQRHGVNPFDYLRDVLTLLPRLSNQDDLTALIPSRWAARQKTKMA